MKKRINKLYRVYIDSDCDKIIYDYMEEKHYYFRQY